MALADYKVTYPSGVVRKKRLNEQDAEAMQERLGEKGKVERERNLRRQNPAPSATNETSGSGGNE